MSMQPTFRPLFEPLEQRDLLAAGPLAYVNAGNLYVLGTPAGDFIQVTQSNNQIAVTGASITVGNAQVNSVGASTISKVIVYGYGGNDNIDLASVKNDATIYGGDGNDTIRCGTGNDTVIGGTGFDRVFRPFDATQPFLNGASISDIHQGPNPLCQTDAALAEAITQGHDFAGDIHYLGNHVYDVKLHGKSTSQHVTFDGWTNPNDPVVANGEFWTILLQRARLQSLGIDPAAPHTMSQWNELDQKSNGRLYSIGEALYCFTGNTSTYDSTAGASPQTLAANLAHGDYVVAQSRALSGYISSDGVIGNHAYAVLAVYDDAGTWKIRLFNPWGTDRGNGSTIDALDKSHPAADDGIITLSWQQFTNGANFKGFFVAARK